MRALGPYERLTRPAVLIGAALGLGARDPRCGRGPHQLLAGGLLAHLSAQGADLLWRVTLQPQLRRRKSRDGAIVDFCARLAREVSAVVGAGEFPIVLGGDHSCAIGTWSGAAKALSARGPLGLVWIDAHMDSHTPSTSPSGMPHGTPLAAGIPAAGLVAALRNFSADRSLLALEVVEYNPDLDRGRKTAVIVEEILAAVLGAPAASARSPEELERSFGARNYDSLPVVLVRGRGAHLWDDHGRRYLDLMSAYSSVSHGHCHPRLVAALSRQAQTLAVTSRAYYNTRLPLFLERLCRLTGLDQALPTNTGLEAVETALKAARKWAYKVKGVPEDSAEIIACSGNFHGRSIAIIAMSTEPQYRDGFGPFPRGFKLVPFGDAKAFERAITASTAAFLVEPIQGEQGIIVPPRGYLAECERICRRHNVLLIADEVQTGLGRTGRLLACDHEGVKPDGLTLGKALGGGLLPVSAFLGRREVMAVFQPGDHGSTFGGNPLAAAVALEALDVLVEERLVERSAELGEILLSGLRAIDSPVVREVRGLGLFSGIDIDPAWASAREVVMRLLARGILTRDTHHTVVRVAPPLVINRTQLEWALKKIRGVLAEIERGFKRAA